MTKTEREFRKFFKEEYFGYLVITKKDSYDYGQMTALENVAEKIFNINVDKLEEKLTKEFRKMY